MIFGIDFDNTIVSYHKVFHKVALESDLIPADLPVSKIAVRDFLRKEGKEDVWTEIQGYVYGARMEAAEPFEGVIEFFRWARESGKQIVIISHKTKYPYKGPQYDLHKEARKWVSQKFNSDESALIREDAVFFEITKSDKFQRISDCKCNYFIDDLPEILEAEEFPEETRGILFDPQKLHTTTDRWICVSSWTDLKKVFE